MRRALTALLIATLTLAGLAAADDASAAAAAAHRFAITKIYFDSPGSDTGSNTSLNGEWVAIKNITGSAHSLDGYRVVDRSGHAHYFGNFTVSGGHTIYLHTGHGSATTVAKYWGSSGYIWNNDGDTATMRNQYGTYVDSCSYTAASDPVTSC